VGNFIGAKGTALPDINRGESRASGRNLGWRRSKQFRLGSGMDPDVIFIEASRRAATGAWGGGH